MPNTKSIQLAAALVAAGFINSAMAVTPVVPLPRPTVPVLKPPQVVAVPSSVPQATPLPQVGQRPVQLKDLMPVYKPQPAALPVLPPPVPMPPPRAQVELQRGPVIGGVGGVVPALVVPVNRAVVEIKGPELHPQILPPEPGISGTLTLPLPERK